MKRLLKGIIVRTRQIIRYRATAKYHIEVYFCFCFHSDMHTRESMWRVSQYLHVSSLILFPSKNGKCTHFSINKLTNFIFVENNKGIHHHSMVFDKRKFNLIFYNKMIYFSCRFTLHVYVISTCTCSFLLLFMLFCRKLSMFS